VSAIARKRDRSDFEKDTRLSEGPPKKKQRKDLHHLTMRKMYIHQIRNGEKTVEGRISKGAVLKYLPGDKIRFYYFSNASDDVTCQIVAIKCFASFKDMLVDAGVKNCLPNVNSVEDGVKAYDSIPKYSEKAAQFGVTAIHLRRI